MTGLWTLFYKEILRFWKVKPADHSFPGGDDSALPADFFPCAGRARPCLSGRELHGIPRPWPGDDGDAQNAFANSSSSLIQSKMNGSIVFILLPPLAYWEFFAAMWRPRWCVAGGGLGVGLAGLWFTVMPFAHPLWILALPCSAVPCWARWALFLHCGRRVTIRCRRCRISSSCH